MCFYNSYYLYVGCKIYHNHLTIVFIEIGLECIKSMCTPCIYVFTSYSPVEYNPWNKFVENRIYSIKKNIIV